jgi:TRAP-type C4-dicarboxylate transport system permease large subunit
VLIFVWRGPPHAAVCRHLLHISGSGYTSAADAATMGRRAADVMAVSRQRKILLVDVKAVQRALSIIIPPSGVRL